MFTIFLLEKLVPAGFKNKFTHKNKTKIYCLLCRFNVQRFKTNQNCLEKLNRSKMHLHIFILVQKISELFVKV